MVEHKFNKHDIFSLQEWSSQYKTFTNETRDHLNCVSSVSGLTISAMQTTPLFFCLFTDSCHQVSVISCLCFLCHTSLSWPARGWIRNGLTLGL